MSSLLDQLAAREVQANTEREKVTAAGKAHLEFNTDHQCPECGVEMKATTVAGPLPARVCFDCRICLPSTE
jgi:ABC-type ATPase with predicted acetyltransferase domain